MSGFRGEGWSPGQPTRKASSHSKARDRCRAPLFLASAPASLSRPFAEILEHFRDKLFGQPDSAVLKMPQKRGDSGDETSLLRHCKDADSALDLKAQSFGRQTGR